MIKKIIAIASIIIIIVITFFLGFTYINKKNSSYGSINQYRDLKSGDLATDYTIPQALNDIKSMNLNTINIPIVVNIKTLNSNEVEIENWSLDRAIELIKELKGTNVKIILEPYPWIDNGSKYETNFNPTDKKLFFENWEDNVIKPILNKVAIPYNVFAINIASNFVNLYSYSTYWDNIIAYIRKNFKGFITYKVSWWYTAKWDRNSYKNFDDVLNNETLSRVDFISVAAYFELSNNEYNTVEQLKNDLYSTTRYNREQDVVKQLYELHKKWNKPIFFGELGFPKKAGAAIEPWNENISNTVNDTEQANCFKAYEEVFSKKDWILGFSVFAIGNNNTDHWYYPCNESKEIIKNWYNK
ncbi:glycoside hydrolase family 113 [Clostridium massiliamazoniense]|uniref:glycoside hydrolase family 113 n=1 Tax=Clostridium massiliamazoniense TaxID=1347366 RepID=UPI0006D8486F|nr:hypothetical protein [Clostridium massiliamazoniense]